jgi:hypothetical protein
MSPTLSHLAMSLSNLEVLRLNYENRDSLVKYAFDLNPQRSFPEF